jgi:hypothetical protein
VSGRIVGVKTLYLTPVESVKINTIIGEDIGFESNRDLTIHAIADVLGYAKAKEVRDWLDSVNRVKFEVVLE